MTNQSIRSSFIKWNPFWHRRRRGVQ